MRWKMIFVFLTGFMLHELFTHVWLAVDGLLPLTTRMFFGITLTPALNTFAIAVNSSFVIVFAYLGLFHNWEHRASVERGTMKNVPPHAV